MGISTTYAYAVVGNRVLSHKLSKGVLVAQRVSELLKTQLINQLEACPHLDYLGV